MSFSNHALVVGASGLIGWAVVDQLLRGYPNPTTFSKITALVNRPLSVEDSYWPIGLSRPDLRLVPGVDLQCDDNQEFEKLLRDKVPDIATVSHVFYFAFKSNPDNEQEVNINVSMMRLVIRTIKQTSASTFKFFVYPGGTRGYGIYLPGGIFSAPLHESLADSLPEDYKKTVSYPHYRALLEEESESMDWKWCELCPDAIIGFTPNGSGFSLAGHWATYLCAWKLVYGEGADVPFPGTLEGYDALYTETSAKTLARVAIHASLHPSVFSSKIFNVADSATPGNMRERWPQIASWFGLKGVPPLGSASSTDVKPSEFVRHHHDKLKAASLKGIDIGHSVQLDSYGYWLTFDRHLSLQRLRNSGFAEETKPQDGWWEAFGMFKRAGMIV